MSNDVQVVRELAKQVAQIVHSDQNQKARLLWANHNALRKVERPPVMCRPCGGWEELVPWRGLVCAAPVLREIEYVLRMRLYKHTIGDDEVFEPWVDVSAVHLGPDRPMMWGVNIDVVHSATGGAFIFTP